MSGTTEERGRPCNPGLQLWEIKPQNLWLKTPVGVVVAVGETPSLTGELVGETHRVLEHIQTYPPRESAPEGPNLLVRKWLKACQEPSKCHCPLSEPSPTYSATTQPCGLPHLGEYLRLHLLQHNRCTKANRYGPNERTNQNSKNRTEQWRDSQLMRCRVQTTCNQDAHRNGWVWPQNREKCEG